MNPATEYVAKFTEEIDKARVVHARGLAKPVNGHALEGAPINGGSTIHELARVLVNDKRILLPVADDMGKVTGVLERDAALNVLLGAD
jgi:glycine betaine/proline transport system ATP-binding protein